MILGLYVLRTYRPSIRKCQDLVGEDRWRWIAGSPAGCVLATRPRLFGLLVTLTAPIAILPQQAHAVLQDGWLVNASNRLNSWCELEVRISCAAGQSSSRLVVRRVRSPAPSTSAWNSIGRQQTGQSSM